MNVPSAVHDGLLAWHALNQRLALMLLHQCCVCLCLLTLNETLCNSPKVLCASGTRFSGRLWWKVPDVKLNLIWVLLTSQMWLADEKSVISWWREEYFNLYVNMRNNSENKTFPFLFQMFKYRINPYFRDGFDTHIRLCFLITLITQLNHYRGMFRKYAVIYVKYMNRSDIYNISFYLAFLKPV